MNDDIEYIRYNDDTGEWFVGDEAIAVTLGIDIETGRVIVTVRGRNFTLEHVMPDPDHRYICGIRPWKDTSTNGRNGPIVMRLDVLSPPNSKRKKSVTWNSLW